MNKARSENWARNYFFISKLPSAITILVEIRYCTSKDYILIWKSLIFFGINDEKMQKMCLLSSSRCIIQTDWMFLYSEKSLLCYQLTMITGDVIGMKIWIWKTFTDTESERNVLTEQEEEDVRKRKFLFPPHDKKTKTKPVLRNEQMEYFYYEDKTSRVI